jgi:nucleoside phosphorylase
VNATTPLAFPPVDFLLITALQEELDAVLRRLETRMHHFPDDPHTYHVGQFESVASGNDCKVVAVQLMGPGNNEASSTTVRAIQHWRPSYVVMVGIAGGVAGRTAFGDVLVAEYVHYYELAKDSPAGTEHRPRQFWTDRLLYGRADAYRKMDWLGDIGVEPPGKAAARRAPAVKFGPLASGERVVATQEFVNELKRQCPKMIGIAMEGAGVARAALEFNPVPAFIEIRGVSDLANKKKNDRWHAFAAETAGAFAVGLVRSGLIPSGAPQEVSSSQVLSPLVILRGQSLRQIDPGELIADLPPDLKGREFTSEVLDFTDLTQDRAVSNPEAAVGRLTDPAGALSVAMADRGAGQLVFHGLLSIPLTVLAGHLVTDRQSVRLIDFHPELDRWGWPDEDGTDFPELSLNESRSEIEAARDAVLRFSVTGSVTRAQTMAVAPEPAIEVDLSIPQPVQGAIRSERQVRAYGRIFREVIDRLSHIAPPIDRIQLFYAGPVSLAFHVGQRISENMHTDVIVWNFRQGYDWGVNIQAARRGEASIVRPTGR